MFCSKRDDWRSGVRLWDAGRPVARRRVVPGSEPDRLEQRDPRMRFDMCHCVGAGTSESSSQGTAVWAQHFALARHRRHVVNVLEQLRGRHDPVAKFVPDTQPIFGLIAFDQQVERLSI